MKVLHSGFLYCTLLTCCSFLHLTSGLGCNVQLCDLLPVVSPFCCFFNHTCCLGALKLFDNKQPLKECPPGGPTPATAALRNPSITRTPLFPLFPFFRNFP